MIVGRLYGGILGRIGEEVEKIESEKLEEEGDFKNVQ